MHSCLMHGNNIGISLHQIAQVFVANGLTRLMNAIEDIALMIYIGLRRVDVFGLFLIASEGSGSEPLSIFGWLQSFRKERK